MNMIHISKADFDHIGDDYKGVYMDYHGTHPKRKAAGLRFFLATEQRFTSRESISSLMMIPHTCPYFAKKTQRRARRTSSAAASCMSIGSTGSVQNTRAKTTLHI